ncbi:MAG: alpha/beta hydrolase [Chloroflexi bacterium]|nr:alpha/beta hydrolase [Chloroflexota bacterium]
MPTVKVGDINMYYEVHGKGEPLLLIMGLGTDLTGWMFQIPEFSKKYQVIAFDNRGVGRTDAPDEPYSIKMMADDTVWLMDALGINRAHILGLSMGGMIAQELAIKYPERVKSLVLATTSAGNYPFSDHTVGAWAAAKTEGVSPRTYFRLIFPFIFTDKLFENSGIVEMALDTMAAAPYLQPAHALAHQVTAATEHNALGRLSHIVAPTLVLVGKQDILLPVKLSKELATGIDKAKLVVLEGGGHAFNVEIRDKFNQAVLDFLAQIA